MIFLFSGSDWTVYIFSFEQSAFHDLLRISCWRSVIFNINFFIHIKETWSTPSKIQLESRQKEYFSSMWKTRFPTLTSLATVCLLIKKNETVLKVVYKMNGILGWWIVCLCLWWKIGFQANLGWMWKLKLGRIIHQCSTLHGR